MGKRFFTVLFLPSNPSRVKKLILSEFLIKSLAISAMILLLASSVIFFDYINVKKKEVDLTGLKEQTKIQNVQLQTFADKINDMEVELSRLRSLDTKIRVLTNTKTEEPGVKSGRISLGGRGGPEPTPPLSFDREALLKDMVAKLDRLNIEAKEQEKSLHELHASIQNRESLLAATPSLWPVRGYISSGFGDRESPFDSGNEFHEGIDISAPSGSTVAAAAEGVVTFAARNNDLGNAVTIDHGYGIVSRYGHMSEISVHIGQKVRAGERIGAVGSTGRSTGPHLHYEVAVNGYKVNPIKYLN
ncbi:MAG TPA: M23 family metallopeptidase [Thermodesulfobacteriota bacterium]|nr:M23 family metallopeptidase [Thermodesulfobacteriota bacterium]